MATLTAFDVSACLVTRGDVDLAPILDTLIFGNIVVWNNADRDDWKTAGRYKALEEAARDVIYFQDDDVIVPEEMQQALVAAYQPGMLVANWAHGDNPDGYDDLPLVGAGAIVDRSLPWKALNRYLDLYPLDAGFLYEADFVAGALYDDWRHVRLPFEIRDVAYNGRRLADQPWQRDLKLEVTNRARAIRDERG